MNKQIPRCFLLAIASIMQCYPAQAAAPTDKESTAELRKELEAIKQEYLEKIRQLEQRLEQTEILNEETQENVEQLAIDVSQKSNQNSANTFNPAIGMILNGRWISVNDDFQYSVPGFFLAEEIGPGDQGIQLGESELNMSANVDDKFYASTTIAFGEETEVEEAYIQTLALGNGFKVKAGKFFSSIGYLTSKHAHSDDFASRPLPYEVFLGGQYGDAGIQTNWLAPTDLYWESGFEFFRGDSFPAAGANNSGMGAWTAFTHIGGDFSQSQSWRAGVSFLNAEVDQRESDSGEIFSGDSHLWIADFILKWNPVGKMIGQQFKLQGEYFLRNEKGLFNGSGSNNNNLDDTYFNSDTSGWYLQGVYRFSRQWRVGLRAAHLSSQKLPALFDDSLLDFQNASPKQTSVMLDWSNSEFSRIRLQYDRYELNGDPQNGWILQYIAAFGAHGAHSF